MRWYLHDFSTTMIKFRSCGRLIRLAMWAAIVQIIALPAVIAEENTGAEISRDVVDRKYVLGIAVGLERFDTNIKLTDPQTGNSTFIDAEGNFGLPESKTVPIIYGAVRFNERHGFGFYAFKVNRSGSNFNIDEGFGNLRVIGNVSLADKSSFSYLTYHYRLFDDQRVLIRGLLGLYAMDLSLELNASGQITLNDVPVLSGQYTESISQFAALPLIRLDFWSTVEGRWAMGARVAMITGSYDDVSASVVDAAIQGRYQMTEHVALIAGVNYLSADVEIARPRLISDIRYGYDGVFFGFDFNF